MVTWKSLCSAIAAALLLCVAGGASAKTFAQEVGNVRVGNVQCDMTSSKCEVPYILWGGEAATFLANGISFDTTGGTFKEKGLKIKLVRGDDPVQQAKAYLSGKTPVWRGTMRMLGIFAELANGDPRTQPVVAVQMTYSRGDHAVAKAGIKKITDIKGKRVALLPGGPHEGLLADMLEMAGLSWRDIKIVPAGDITGPKGPGELFKRGKADVAFVVTPDMIALTGGLRKKGTGGEGTVRGAHVLVSTADFTRSIADVYAFRKDFADQHPDVVAKFTVAYLRAVEKVVDLKKNLRSREYRKLLGFMVKAYPKGSLPNANEAHGLIEDCAFVGHAGNVAFFKDPKNQFGFSTFVKSSTKLAVDRGYARRQAVILPPSWDWHGAPFAGYLQRMDFKRGSTFKGEMVEEELELLASQGLLGEAAAHEYSINFEVNEARFDSGKKEYQTAYDQVLRASSKAGGMAIAVAGHADPTLALKHLVRAGDEKGLLKVRGAGVNRQYFLQGRRLTLENTAEIVKLIQKGKFDGSTTWKPRKVMRDAKKQSLQRAMAVRQAILDRAKKLGVKVDPSQIKAIGVGITEPVVPRPRNKEQAAPNRRVDFGLVRVSAEAVTADDFDF